MKLTEREIRMFQNLAKISEGAILAEYLDRLTAYICDIRNLDGISNAERLNISRVMKEYVIDKLKLNNPDKSKDKNPYV